MRKLLKEARKQRKAVMKQKQRKVAMRQQLRKEVMILQQRQVKREKKVPLEQLVLGRLELGRQVQVGMQIQPHLKNWNLTRLRL